MENKDKPAYPVTHDWDNVQKKVFTTTEKQGLTKREMFAMAAMQGICANPTSDIPAQAEPIARIAIEIADELLKQLES